jgi:hypothetical protein
VDWSTWLGLLLDLRAADGPDSDVYYYGVANPTDSLVTYTGFPDGLAASLDAPEDPTLRAAVGLGYGLEEIAQTMAHEIGHAHGRRHTVCGGAAGADPDYPYLGGIVGVPVYDMSNGRLLIPDLAFDIMGYCNPKAISDYGYARFDESIHLAQMAAHSALSSTKRHLRLVVHPDGTMHRLSPIESAAPGGRAVVVVLVMASGERVKATGRFSSFDHVAGGILQVPADARWRVRDVEVDWSRGDQ